MKKTNLGILCGMVCCALLWAASSAFARTWTARSGGFTVEAELVDFKNKTAFLKRDDNGKTIQVPAEKLSLGDLKHIRETMKELTDEIGTSNDNPFPSGASESASESDSAEAEPSKPVKIEKSDTSIKATGGKSVIVPDPPKTTYDIDPTKVDVDEGFTGFSPQAVHSMYTCPYYAVLEKAAWTRYELETGKKNGRVLPSDRTIDSASLSPDGKKIAYIPSQKQVIVASFEDATVKTISTAQLPKVMQAGRLSLCSLQGVMFMPDDRLLLMCNKQCVIYDLPSDKYLNAPVEPLSNLGTFSPGGRYVVLAGRKSGIRFLDVNHQFKEVWRFRIPLGKQPKAMSFSPDGKAFAALIDDGGQQYTLLLLDFAKPDLVLRKVKWDSDFVLTSLFSHKNQWIKLQWFPEGSGWLVQGQFFIPSDEESEAVRIPVEASNAEDAVRLIGENRVMLMVNSRLVTKTLNMDNLKQMGKLAAQGGEKEDVLLPELTELAEAEDFKTLPLPSDPDEYLYQPQKRATEWSFPHVFSPNPLNKDQKPANIYFADSDVRKALLCIEGAPGLFSEFREKFSILHPLVYLDTVDLNTAKTVSRFEMEYPAEVGDVSDDFSQVALILKTHDRTDRVDCWSLDSKEHLLGFRLSHKGGPVHQAFYIGDDHLLLQAGRKSLHLINISEGQEVYQQVNGSFRKILVTPDDGAVIFPYSSHFYLQNPLTGEPLGMLEDISITQEFRFGAGAFSRDGQKLAILSGESTRNLEYVGVWDLTNGKLLAEYPVPFDAKRITWSTNDDLVLMGHQQKEEVETLAHGPTSPGEETIVLVDAESGQFLWNYHLEDGFIHLLENIERGHLFWKHSKYSNKNKSVQAVSLPGEKEAEILLSHEGKPVTYLLSPGKTFQVDLSIDNLSKEFDQQEEIKKTLRERMIYNLGSAGMKVSESEQPLKLKVEMESIDTEEDFYFRLLGRGIAHMKVPDMLIRCKVAILSNDETLWSTKRSIKTSNSGHFGYNSIPSNDGVEAFLEKRPWNAMFHWLEELPLPSYLFPEDACQGLGTTELRETGRVMVRSP